MASVSEPPMAGEEIPKSQESWTYPTRTCRVCLEDVLATVTLYPPGLPPAFQRPIVEYTSEDECGRLVKPCKCRGSMRYIHELCLRRTRTESRQPGALWKCQQCGHKFNFNRLTVQKYLDSKISSGVLTILFMMVVMFLLGFIADPILNLYADPYETLTGHEDVWQTVTVTSSKQSVSGWGQHFLKGLVSMGLLSFLRTMILNPFQWWNLRNTGFVAGRASGRSTTGRDRAISISWVAVVMGLLSASYLFYKLVQNIISMSLKRIGNNVVDTQLPGDDDDLKPPTGWKFASPVPEAGKPNAEPGAGEDPQPDPTSSTTGDPAPKAADADSHPMPGEWEYVESHPMPAESESRGFTSALNDAQDQGWSFNRL